ncbi:MAG: chorismate lyase [Methylibium sp.]|nr:chorismate lyase [Methylibium sp.]
MPDWCSRLPRSRALARWLSAPGSLSAQIARVFGSLTVQRTCQRAGRASRDEALALGLAPGQRVHVREVILRCDGRPLISARTVVEPASLKGPWRALTGLGTRPLAELLFQDAGVRRSPLAYTRINLSSASGRRQAAAWRRATDQHWSGEELWARRAVYVRRGHALLVTEVFAPAVEERAPQLARAVHSADRTRLAPAHAGSQRPRREAPATGQ